MDEQNTTTGPTLVTDTSHYRVAAGTPRQFKQFAGKAITRGGKVLANIILLFMIVFFQGWQAFAFMNIECKYKHNVYSLDQKQA